MKIKVREIVAGVLIIGLGATVVILGLKNSKLSGEIETLKLNLSDMNNRCDTKDRYIGKIMTELKNQK